MSRYSTIFFVDGNPIGYKIFRKANQSISIHPAENPTREVQPPAITARLVHGKWEITGTSNQSLINQVLDELRLNKDQLAGPAPTAP